MAKLHKSYCYNISVSREGEDLSASDAHPKLAMKDEPSPVAMDTSTAETKKRPNLASLGKKEERTVFVSNLSPTITEDQLKHHFSQASRLDNTYDGVVIMGKFGYIV